jgi:hypothetical protein
LAILAPEPVRKLEGKTMNQDPITQDTNLPSDVLETMSSSNPSTPDTPEDSPSSEYDAGLDDEMMDEADISEGSNDKAADGEIGEDDATEYSRREIPMTDLPDAPREDFIHSPDTADMNVPGEIDIEDLDEDSVMDALPPDARLDPLED